MLKNRFLAVLTAVCVALAFSTSYSIKKLSEAKERGKKLEKTISAMDNELKTYKISMSDSLELYAATVDNLNMTRKNLQDKCEDLTKKLKIKPKEVQRYSEIKTYIHDTVRTVAKVDTFGGLNAEYKDDFALIKVNIDVDRNALIDYSIKDSLTVFNHQKRHSILFGLIKWNSTEKTTIVSHNPKASIINFNSVNIIK